MPVTYDNSDRALKTTTVAGTMGVL